MAYYEISDVQEFDEKIRKLETTDRGHADVFNEIFQQVINNLVYEKREIQLLNEQLSEEIQESLKITSNVDGRLAGLQSNFLQLAMVVQTMTDAEVINSDNVVLELFNSDDDVVLISGYYDSENKRLYA